MSAEESDWRNFGIVFSSISFALHDDDLLWMGCAKNWGFGCGTG
jgi:hypothetical protein